MARPLRRRGLGPTAVLALAWALLGLECHNRYVGYEKRLVYDDSVDFVLLEGDLYYLLARTVEKAWWPLLSEGGARILLDRVDFLVAVRGVLGSGPASITASERATILRHPSKDFVLLRNGLESGEVVRVEPREAFEASLCSEPEALRQYAFSPERSHWLAVCGSDLRLFGRGGRERTIEGIERLFPLSGSGLETGRHKLFLAEDAGRVVLAELYTPTEGELELTRLGLRADLPEPEPVRVKLPGRAQVMDVAVTESEVLVMVEFVPALERGDGAGGRLRQAILSAEGREYPMPFGSEAPGGGRVPRFAWDPARGVIVVHRLLERDDVREVVVHAYDYERGGERSMRWPLSEVLGERFSRR